MISIQRPVLFMIFTFAALMFGGILAIIVAINTGQDLDTTITLFFIGGFLSTFISIILFNVLALIIAVGKIRDQINQYDIENGI